MPLTTNHMEHFEQGNIPKKNLKVLKYYVDNENRLKDRLIIANVLPGSYLSNDKILTNGTLLCKINGHSVRTIDELKKYIKDVKFVKNKPYITITEKNRENIIISIEQLIKDEEGLRPRYKYIEQTDIVNYFKTLLSGKDYVPIAKQMKTPVQLMIKTLQSMDPAILRQYGLIKNIQ